SPPPCGEGLGVGSCDSFAGVAIIISPPRICYEIDRLIEPHPIFPLIQGHAQVDDSEMFEVFNMGIGFCYVVEAGPAPRPLPLLKTHGRGAQGIRAPASDPPKRVRIPAR